MTNKISVEKAKKLLEKYVKTQFIREHSIEAGVIMGSLAKHFNEDEEIWEVSGILHDLDMDEINGDYSIHGITTKKILENEGYEVNEVIKPILAHTECLEEMNKEFVRETRIDFALAAAEQITGIITAYARMRPNKFEDMQVKSLTKKFKDKAFAANVNRDFINDIEKAGLERGEFFKIAIDAIYEIKEEINI